jgi:hypothetical protein
LTFTTADGPGIQNTMKLLEWLGNAALLVDVMVG